MNLKSALPFSVPFVILILVLALPRAVAAQPIADKINFGTQIFADFLVCPLTTQEPGVMQTVCVESAANLKVTSR